ncbi:tripartite tricarboxylate transporter TctB family protein [Clostridium phoceensis]|uniref:tripartite tricarboxylate transporter TctB family protein n=1 Tax=Clostridium phoceensis TaxID=1650661 RepID=UPI00067F0447|nr:tripartite tricarboxylate transporter TctB family protein [Clostridium phoceensis]
MVGNLILIAATVLVSGIVLAQTSTFSDYSSISAVGPEAVPNVLAVLMLAIAAILAVQEVQKILRGRYENPTYVQAELQKTKETWAMILSNKMGILRVAGNLIMIVLFALLLRTVGFEICAFVFLAGGMLLNGVRKVWQIILLPICTIAIIYGVFVVALRINIPMLFL